MTPLPKRRLSTRRQTQREKGLKLLLRAGVKCSNCGSLCRPHHVCKKCGYYDGKEVLKIKVKTTKKE